MPNYYSPDPIESVSRAAMIGFELFGRYKDRVAAEEQRKIENERADQRMKMDIRQDERAAESHNIELGDHIIAANDKDLAERSQAAHSLFAVNGADESKWTPEARAARDQLVRSEPGYENADDAAVSARGRELAMRGGDYVETEAIKERTRAENMAARGDLLGLENDALGAPAASGGPSAPLGSNARTNAMSRGNRNNNPGNLRASGDQWQGMSGVDDQGFVVFDTPEAGMRAAQINLANQMDSIKGPVTLRSVIAKYAPASDNNDPEAYAAHVAQQLGISPDQELDLRDPAVNAAVLQQIVAVEQGQPAAATPVGNAPAPAQGGGAGAAVVPARPRSLGEIQAQKDSVSPLQPIKDVLGTAGGGEARARKYAGALDPTNDNPDAADIRRNGARYAPDYAGTRDALPQAQRAEMDKHILSGAATRLSEISTELTQLAERQKVTQTGVTLAGPLIQGKVNALVHEKDQLKAATGKILQGKAKDAAAANIRGSVKPGEQAAAALIAANTAGKNNAPVATVAEARGLASSVEKWGKSPPEKLTADQITRLNRAVELGVISMEQALTFVRTRRLTKPDRQYEKITDGLMLRIEDGQESIIDYTATVAAMDANKATAKARAEAAVGGGLSPEQRRLNANDRLEQMGKYIVGEYKAGNLDDDMSEQMHVARATELITRYRPQLEAEYGLTLTDPATGNTTLAYVEPGAMAILLQGYSRYDAGEEQPWIFKGGKEFADPSYINPGAKAAQPATSDDGWTVIQK